MDNKITNVQLCLGKRQSMHTQSLYTLEVEH